MTAIVGNAGKTLVVVGDSLSWVALVLEQHFHDLGVAIDNGHARWGSFSANQCLVWVGVVQQQQLQTLGMAILRCHEHRGGSIVSLCQIWVGVVQQ